MRASTRIEPVERSMSSTKSRPSARMLRASTSRTSSGPIAGTAAVFWAGVITAVMLAILATFLRSNYHLTGTFTGWARPVVKSL